MKIKSFYLFAVGLGMILLTVFALYSIQADGLRFLSFKDGFRVEKFVALLFVVTGGISMFLSLQTRPD